MRTLRRVLFYIFLLAYLIAMPTAILYALGYIWAPGSERGLVRSGLIAVASTPDDAQIYLGNSRYTRRTPTTIRDLLPGSYTVRLTQHDCEAWQGDVSVEAERATVLDHIVLLPANRAPQMLNSHPWRDLHTEAGEKYLVLEAQDQLGQWAILNASDGTTRPLLPTNSVWQTAHVLQSWFCKESPHALLRVESSGHERYFWLTLNDEDEPPLDISRLFPDPPDEVIWDPRAHREIYTRTGSRIHRLDLKEMAIYPDVAPPAKGIAILRNHLYILATNNVLLRVASGGEMERADHAIPPALSEKLQNEHYSFSLLPNDGLLIRDEIGALWINNPPGQLVPQGARVIMADRKNDQWIIATDSALGLLTSDAQSKTDDFTLHWLHTESPPINRAAWIHDETHILYASQGNLMLLALERGGGGPPRNVVPVNSTGSFYFSERTGFLYALNTQGHLTRLRLLPPRSLIPLPLRTEDSE